MGASDSKLVFKKGIFRLSEERHIPADDEYWTQFWELPESSEDIFSLFAPADIRRTRDNAIENLETLILAVTSRLFILRHHPSFPDNELAPERDALNCIRVLTRILPYIYEVDSLHVWEDQFFWGTRRKRTRRAILQPEVLFDEAQVDEAEAKPQSDEFEEAKPLAEELIDTLIDLLFFSDLTVPKQPHGKPKVTYAIWQSGVGCNTAVATTKEHENNRSEILRLLLTLAGQSMYESPSVLPTKGTKALTYLCTCSDKQVVLSVLCSLLNTTLKYNPASWRVPYNALVFKDPKEILVTYTLQLLLVTILYPIPENSSGTSQKNYYRHFLGRLHRPQDFQFIVDGMTRILNQPFHANTTSYIPGTQAVTKFSPETIMLFWEITQCNKRFRSYMIDTERAHDFLILILYYATEYKLDASKQGVVRMCAFLLQTLSVEPKFGMKLNKSFEGQNTLPLVIRIAGFRGSYADFLIQTIYSLITTSQGKLSVIYPALLAVINNISAYLEGINGTTSSRLLQLFSSMSSPSFLLANDSNHDLLSSLLESMNAIIEHQYKKNPQFVYTILKHKKRFEALRSFTLESGQAEVERRNRQRKESGQPTDPFDLSSRDSVDSLRSPTTAQPRTPTLSDVPEEDGTFAIGDDEDESDNDDDDDERPTPAQSSPREAPSQASSVADPEDAVPTQLRGMSEKARGKMPAGTPSFSRQNSVTSLSGFSAQAAGSAPGMFEPSAHWIESWLPELPLHTVLTVIQQLTVLINRQDLPAGEAASAAMMQKIRDADLVGIDPSPIRVHSFEWSPLALGWYESLVWSFAFASEMQISKGTAGIWNGTAIKLFRVQGTAPQGPSLSSPRGAIDMVGTSIVSRIGAMNLQGGQDTGAGAASAAGGSSAAAPNRSNTQEQ
ncbi:Ubp5-interacting protein [Apiospora saccharicola]|uniref:Ubp5-interacting protein n=1 Tax=Apiospora saccharicola TaxID=335842 RepID=A0ABR1TQ39_9PEZI